MTQDTRPISRKFTDTHRLPAGKYTGRRSAMVAYWGCAESYIGTGRPSRVWAEETVGPDVRPDREQVYNEAGDTSPAYPYNGMGGAVIAGPFDNEAAALTAVNDMITETEGGWLYWKWQLEPWH